MINYISHEKFDDLVGFDENNEFLPKGFDEFKSKEKLRQLFFNMANNVTKGICHFNKYEQVFLSKHSLKQAFKYKIDQMLANKYIYKEKRKKYIFNFCKSSTIIINNYKNPNNKNLFISKNCRVNAAKLISLCHNNSGFKLLIDKHLLFHEFVLKKIKKLHSDKTVIDLGNAISIKSDEFYGIKILTSWKDIEVGKPNIKDELENAIETIKNNEFYQIYLAYPKNDTFKKQIPIYVDELKNTEYQIKAIPYSLRSIIK